MNTRIPRQPCSIAVVVAEDELPRLGRSTRWRGHTRAQVVDEKPHLGRRTLARVHRVEAAGAQAMTEDALDDLLRASLRRDSVKDAVAHAVELSGRPRREIYARALELAKQGKGDHGED